MPSSDIEEVKSSAASALNFSWQELSYSVKAKGSTRKTLIDNVSGKVKAGEMLAILGPSGAGKSTLLDLLAGRKSLESGKLTLDGRHEAKQAEVRDIAAYVEQEDALLGVLTVKETIRFSARLALLDSRMSTKQVNDFADETIQSLGLAGVSDNKIGTPISRGISGGQKRRVSVANALTLLPQLLFLDEPTSGLDSATAFQVMSAIKEVARQRNIAVVATIHSPNWEVFSLFDSVHLLAQGKTIYSGTPHQVAPYFGKHGFECPRHTNPADHMLSIISADFGANARADLTSGSPDVLCVGDVPRFASLWTNSDQESKVELIGHQSSHRSNRSSKSFFRGFRKLIMQNILLVQRNFLNYSRNLLAYGVRFGMYVGMGILLATVWVRLPQVDGSINDRLSVHFFSVAFLGFMSVAGIPAFLEERAVFVREKRNNLYGPGPYTIAQTITVLPFLFVCVLVFAVICYWSIGLHPGGAHFFRFLAFIYLGVITAEVQSLLIAAIIPVFVAALAIAAFLNGFWMAVQGYFIRNIPDFWRVWAHYVDYQTYAFQLLVKSDFIGLVFPCSGTIQQGDCLCTFPSSLIQQGTCATAGSDVVQSLGFQGTSTVLYAFILVIIFVFYRVCFYVTLKLTV